MELTASANSGIGSGNLYSAAALQICLVDRELECDTISAFWFSVIWGNGYKQELLNLTLLEQIEEKHNKTPLLVEVEEEHNGWDSSNFEGAAGSAVATIPQLISMEKPTLHPKKPNGHHIKVEPQISSSIICANWPEKCIQVLIMLKININISSANDQKEKICRNR